MRDARYEEQERERENEMERHAESDVKVIYDETCYSGVLDRLALGHTVGRFHHRRGYTAAPRPNP